MSWGERHSRRRIALRLFVLACVAWSLLGAASAHADRQLAEQDFLRATTTFGAMQRAYYLPYHNLYRGWPEAYSYLWPFSQALSATVALAGVQPAYRVDMAALLNGLAHYWKANKSPPSYGSYVTGPLGPGGTTFYDDDEWVGLQLVRIYRLTGSRLALKQAQMIFRLVLYGWDRNAKHPCPGGVWWTQDPSVGTRNTVSNAPAAELGLYLYELTGNHSYLVWAQRFYAWVLTCLRDPEAGLYEDHVSLDGTLDSTFWTYNQGTMLGTETLLYRITRDPTYLRRAWQDASASLQHFDQASLQAQPSFFISIFLDNLRLLEVTSPGTAYSNAIQEYADWAWSARRDPATGLFSFNDGPGSALLEQASMIQIYAFLSWGPRWYLPPPHAHRLRRVG
ncbi:MAG TPA: glycoside hydrolase family 76 protein [Solirubrobacteraceae bacterium]|nr:glycoside hydrolase family 76 protein [Solirubrobacteraceae bacterium]